MKYYIYILYLENFDKFYIGYTSDYVKRLQDHNTSTHNTFTSKYRAWVLKSAFLVGESESEAVRLERFIKKQKSKTLLQKLIASDFIPAGKLAQLVRVPHVRD